METNINVKDTITVYPSTQPFTTDHSFPLSQLDNDRNLRITFRYLRVYAGAATPNFDHDPFEIIASSLSEALVPYYQFTGKLRSSSTNPSRLELFCSAGRGVPLVLATADCTLDSVNYLDDPSVGFAEDLVPNPSLQTDEALSNPFMLQVTVFKCGGFCLGTAIYHALCDGMGATQFFNVMAEVARGFIRSSPVDGPKKSLMPVAPPVWERERLLGPRDPPRVSSSAAKVLEGALQLDKASVPYGDALNINNCHGSSSNLVEVGKICIEINDEWLDGLKKLLLDQSGGVGRFTTFEALGAFIWRAKVKASRSSEQCNNYHQGEVVKFAYSINIRKLLNPPLPRDYWGNGCVPIYIPVQASDLLTQPLWKTAQLIKDSKGNATDEYVRSFIDFQELNHEKGITAGKGVSGFTDWRHLGHSTVDFGWGGPVNVLPLSRCILGSVEPCFFLPYSSHDPLAAGGGGDAGNNNIAPAGGSRGGFKVLVMMSEDAIPVFKKEMEKLSTVVAGGML